MGEEADVDINVYEYVAAILGFCTVLPPIIPSRRERSGNAHTQYRASCNAGVRSRYVSSRRTYGTGWRAWVAYVEVNGFDPALLEVTVPLRKVVIYFAIHLRETRSPKPGVSIKSVTINQYITHVADYLVMHKVTREGTDLRSRRLTMLLAGSSIADYFGLPMRLT